MNKKRGQLQFRSLVSPCFYNRVTWPCLEMGPLTLMKLNHVSSTNYLTCAVDVYSFGMPKPKSYFQLIMWVGIRPLCSNQKQPWFWIPLRRLPCQRTLDSGFQSLEGFWILGTKLWIPNPRISDSTSKNFPDSETPITLHGCSAG